MIHHPLSSIHYPSSKHLLVGFGLSPVPPRPVLSRPASNDTHDLALALVNPLSSVSASSFSSLSSLSSRIPPLSSFVFPLISGLIPIPSPFTSQFPALFLSRPCAPFSLHSLHPQFLNQLPAPSGLASFLHPSSTRISHACPTLVCLLACQESNSEQRLDIYPVFTYQVSAHPKPRTQVPAAYRPHPAPRLPSTAGLHRPSLGRRTPRRRPDHRVLIRSWGWTSRVGNKPAAQPKKPWRVLWI